MINNISKCMLCIIQVRLNLPNYAIDCINLSKVWKQDGLIPVYMAFWLSASI